ncbi:zinc finger protein [Macleaya cordata]|uniref:Zinc finger protein n=1 Tax=Macleaya cordata TaxID=56857 RepID=A0A200PWK5_MACCD|nr:zinc finger protein [Macleaya cordata]
MMDLSDKGSGSEESSSPKSCSDCQTTKTPLWRGGPAGPKSLCNACGIRYRKKRRALLGLNKVGAIEKKERCSSSSSSSSNNSKIGVSLKLRFLTLGREVLLQRSSMDKQRKLGEEEQAAVLLMALSCGSVYV